MFKDITIGQYYPIDSIIHRLDPRTKIIFTLLTLSCSLSSTTCGVYIAAFALLVGVIIASRDSPVLHCARRQGADFYHPADRHSQPVYDAGGLKSPALDRCILPWKG